MKTLFNNLLLNHRFVFQQAGPEAQKEAPKQEAEQRDFIESLGPGVSQEQLDEFVDQRTKETEKKGAEEATTHSESLARIADAIVNHPEEVKTAINKHDELFGNKKPGKGMTPEQRDILSARLAKAGTDKILSGIEKLKAENPTVKSVLSGGLDTGTTTEVASISPAEGVEKAAEKILTPEQELGEKTVAVINRYANKLDMVNIGNEKLSAKLISNLKEANKDMIQRGANYKVLTQFNNRVTAMLLDLRNVNDPGEIAQQATRINIEIQDAKLGKKYEDKTYYNTYAKNNPADRG